MTIVQMNTLHFGLLQEINIDQLIDTALTNTFHWGWDTDSTFNTR